MQEEQPRNPGKQESSMDLEEAECIGQEVDPQRSVGEWVPKEQLLSPNTRGGMDQCDKIFFCYHIEPLSVSFT